MFRLKSQIMLGINRWDDIDANGHDMWDIILVDVSFSQTIQFNPRSRGSILLGVGLMESANYVYSKGLRFQPGVVLQAGFKL